MIFSSLELGLIEFNWMFILSGIVNTIVLFFIVYLIFKFIQFLSGNSKLEDRVNELENELEKLKSKN